MEDIKTVLEDYHRSETKFETEIFQMQFYEKIEKSLETNNLDTFSRLFYEADQEQKKHIDEYSWDLALLFLNYLQKSNESQDYSLNEFILKANSHLCKYHGSPKELYLVYTQNSDYFLRQDNNFIYLVDLLQTLLERTSFKFISKSIDTSISIFNKKIKNSNLTIYTRIIQFVDSLSQIILENDSNSPSLRLLSEFLIGFFSDVSLNEVFTLITRFNKDLFKFIFCLEDKFEDKIALGNFLHFFLCGNNLTYLNSPLVFDNFFLLQKFLPLTQSLLIDSNNKPALRNGLEILEYLLKKIELYSLTDEMLEIEDILESIDILIKISVYCKYEAIRKQAGMILKNYFEKFNRKSRFEFIKYFLNKNVKFNDAINNFVVSWLIFLFKQELFECFNQEDTFYSESTGNFRYLFEKMVFLRNGFKTDLAGEATQIIACLNLIRFVLIRDKLNQTGVYTILNKNSDFLKELEKAVQFSRLNYETERKNLMVDTASNNSGQESNKFEVSLLNSQKINEPSKEEKLTSLQNSIHTIDMIECLRIRVEEIIQENCSKF